MSNFIQEPKEVKARKDHTCCWCGLKINKGEMYEYSVLKGDDIYSWKNHLHCAKLTSKLGMFDDLWSDGLTADDFSEFVWDWWKNECLIDDSKDYDISWEEVMDFAKKLKSND